MFEDHEYRPTFNELVQQFRTRPPTMSDDVPARVLAHEPALLAEWRERFETQDFENAPTQLWKILDERYLRDVVRQQRHLESGVPDVDLNEQTSTDLETQLQRRAGMREQRAAFLADPWSRVTFRDLIAAEYDPASLRQRIDRSEHYDGFEWRYEMEHLEKRPEVAVLENIFALHPALIDDWWQLQKAEDVKNYDELPQVHEVFEIIAPFELSLNDERYLRDVASEAAWITTGPGDVASELDTAPWLGEAQERAPRWARERSMALSSPWIRVSTRPHLKYQFDISTAAYAVMTEEDERQADTPT